MNKNKKILTAGLCIALGCILLVATAFAGTPETAGYDALKTAMKNMGDIRSMTADIKVSVSDNGNSLITASGILKSACKEGSGSSFTGTLSASGVEKNFEVYEQNGTSILKTSDNEVYYISQSRKPDRSEHNEWDREWDRNWTESEDYKGGEALLDAFMGNLKNEFVLDSREDGSSTIRLQLTGSKIPAVVNTLTSLAVRDAAEERNHTPHVVSHSDLPFMQDLDVELPKLVNQVRMEEINFTVDTDKEGKVTRIAMNTTVSGNDAQGIAHQVALNMSMDLSDVNNTTPDTINLEGKQTQIIENKDFDGSRQ